MSEKVTAMIEEIKGLTVLELSELVHALEEEFGVSAAAMAAPAAGAAAPAAEEKTDFDVVLAGFDAAAKIKVIKVVREITGQGLAEAKATADGYEIVPKEPRLTRRKPLPNGDSLPLRLDWILLKGVTASESRMISTAKEDLTYAKPGSALERFQGAELSDHNAVWAMCRLR